MSRWTAIRKGGGSDYKVLRYGFCLRYAVLAKSSAPAMRYGSSMFPNFPPLNFISLFIHFVIRDLVLDGCFYIITIYMSFNLQLVFASLKNRTAVNSSFGKSSGTSTSSIFLKPKLLSYFLTLFFMVSQYIMRR